MSDGSISVVLEPLADPDRPGEDWRALQERSDHSFFQSWGWIGCWLRRLPPQTVPLVLRATRRERLLGLAVFCQRKARRRGLIVSRGLHLSETGDPRYDRLTVEHNGVLAARGDEAAVNRAVLDFLAAGLRGGRWDEVYLPAVGPAMREAAAAIGLPLVVLKEALSHVVDLAAIRAADGDYLARLGKKTRQHLRRSLRRYAARGELAATLAATRDEAQDFFGELIALHQADWKKRGEPGAFADPWFVDFHRALIDARFEAGEIQLMRVAAGDWTVGFLYHFVYGRRIYSYQWGLAPESDNKINFGMAADYLAVVHNLEAGADCFDFLHGDTLHKRRLGTGSETRYWLVLQRPRLDFELENRLRAAKRRLIGGVPA